ncbi:MAG TPA: hypothetical protein VNG69_10180 [Casimicrobiaceae bacterium]|nr:hypothetical protein [Casimicrobiaceae bacterium]
MTVDSAFKLPLVLGLLLWCMSCGAQQTLGELLDAGAKRLSVQQFRDEVVQRVIAGPSATGGTMEVLYDTDGRVTGIGTFRMGSHGAGTARTAATMEGGWKADEEDRICTALRVVGPARAGSDLPPRCQFWFKLGEDFFFADSDSDRYAKVLRRKVLR